ncbi:MAG: hypothetical protein ACHQDF_06980 [Chitinophagales bacterium]
MELATALVTKQVYTYDHMDRLLTVTHQTGSQEVVTIAQNSYNELGRLLSKKIHQSTSIRMPCKSWTIITISAAG